MTPAPNPRRILRTNRLLSDLGHGDVIDALQHMARMASALRVIHTWATVDGALVPEQVRKLTSRTLKKEPV